MTRVLHSANQAALRLCLVQQLVFASIASLPFYSPSVVQVITCSEPRACSLNDAFVVHGG